MFRNLILIIILAGCFSTATYATTLTFDNAGACSSAPRFHSIFGVRAFGAGEFKAKKTLVARKGLHNSDYRSNNNTQ
ncbi:MAG: hypothetical protein COA42_23250 [Alteromonadaceae bacterium]|nr:MAG: hypothetical protein COA42_23250 [Alteromonadaceae bacterium]